MSTRQKAAVAAATVAALLFTGCFKSKTEVKRVPNNTNTTMKDLNGVFYSLPRTVVTADIPIKRTDEKPGVLEKFAPCFYPQDVADERIRTKNKSFGIDDPTIAFRVEPDPQEHFVVSVKGGYFENKSLLMEYAPGGILQKGEASSENQALDFTIQAAKSATSIITGVAGLPRGASLTAEEIAQLTDKERSLVRAHPCYWTIVEEKLRLLNDAEDARKKAKTAKQKEAADLELCKAKKALDKAVAEARLVSVYGLDVQRRSNTRFRDVNLEADSAGLRTTVESLAISLQATCPDDETKKGKEELISDYDRAAKTFKEIQDLERSRLAAVGGSDSNGPAVIGSGVLGVDALKLMLQELDSAIKKRNGLFFGTETVTPWTGKFEYSPSKIALQAKELLWISEQEGLCETKLSKELGIVIPKKFRAEICPHVPASLNEIQEIPSEMDIIFMQVRKDTKDQDFRDQMARVQTNLETDKKKRGWYYRIPAPAFVTLKVGTLEKADSDRARAAEDRVRGFEQALLGLSTAKNLGTNTLQVAQLGVTVSIPASGAGRTNQSTIEYDQAGALKNFKYSSNSLLQKSQLEELQATAQTVIDAKKASAEEKIKANDPLNKLKTELETLQTQNKINEERKKLEQANSNGDSNTSP